jgi:hypothetical protein
MRSSNQGKLKAIRKKQLKGATGPEPVYDDTEYHYVALLLRLGSATPDGKPIHGITQMVGR